MSKSRQAFLAAVWSLKDYRMVTFDKGRPAKQSQRGVSLVAKSTVATKDTSEADVDKFLQTPADSDDPVGIDVATQVSKCGIPLLTQPQRMTWSLRNDKALLTVDRSTVRALAKPITDVSLKTGVLPAQMTLNLDKGVKLISVDKAVAEGQDLVKGGKQVTETWLARARFTTSVRVFTDLADMTVAEPLRRKLLVDASEIIGMEADILAEKVQLVKTNAAAVQDLSATLGNDSEETQLLQTLRDMRDGHMPPPDVLAKIAAYYVAQEHAFETGGTPAKSPAPKHKPKHKPARKPPQPGVLPRKRTKAGNKRKNTRGA